MELPLLSNSLPNAASLDGAALGGQQKASINGNDSERAGKLAKSAKVLNNELPAASLEKQEIDYRFRLNPALFQALDKAIGYMNRVLVNDGLKMSVRHDEATDHISAVVQDMNNEERIVKEYSPHEVLKYYADSGYGTGVVIDGKI